MRALAWLGITAWTACGAPDLLPDEAPPPAGFGRVPYPQVAGQPLRFRFELPVTRARLRVYASLTDAQACSPAVTGVCLRLAQPQLLAEVPVDPSGTTQVEVAWPTWLDGRAGVHVQAALAVAPGRAAASPVWDDRILDAADDSDHDGLPAAQEHALSLRMDRADTDGGGSLDGQEVADGTRADLAGDDLRVESLCHNGLDDDADGLPDCEDGDCTTGCVEADCADQADDDFDGTIDCADDDCWTTDCVDHTLAWTLHGETQSWWYSSAGPFHRWTGSAAGKVMLFKGAERRTCDWRGYLVMSSLGRGGWVGSFPPRLLIDDECDVGSEVLPPARTALWDRNGWYGMQRFWTRSRQWTTFGWPHVYHYGSGGPLLPPVAFGSCPGGVGAILAWPDLDGDGYGMAEARDLRGVQVDRTYFCGAVPPGFTTLPGDCDDLDPSWSPPLVVLDPGTGCEDLSPVDLDGDGVSPPADPDDRDARTWGQELLCADGSDNDHDGLADCEDSDCFDGPGCSELSCSDHRDNDGDGASDCADDDCWSPRCNTSQLSWLMRGSLTGTWGVSSYGSPAVEVVANDLVGRVRTVGPQGANTCTWTADHAVANFGIHLAPSSWGPVPPITTVERDNFAVTPGCFQDDASIGRNFRPHDGVHPALGWYGPMDVVGTQDNGAVRLLAGGPALDGGADYCYRAQAVRFYFDLDHDGFGVSDPTDLHGALGGLRYACGAVPVGGVTLGGDCDDQDATWSPALITRAPGAPCEAIRPDDRDGDGALVGVDVNDLDGRVQ